MRWVVVFVVLAGCRFTPNAAQDAAIGDDDDDAPIGDDDAPDPPDDAPVGTEPIPPPMIVRTNLIEDLDADVVTGTTTVTAWPNQATGGEDVAVGAGSVAIVDNAIGTHRVLRFSNNARLIGADGALFTPLVRGDGFTWFAVVQPGNQDNAQKNQIFGTIREGGSNCGFTAGANGATQARPYTMVRPTTTELFAQSTTNTSGQLVILAGRLEAGTGNRTAAIFRNSSNGDDTTTINVIGTGETCGALTIGSERTLGAEFYTGDIARILVYKAPLSDADFAMTGRALGEIYGITTTF